MGRLVKSEALKIATTRTYAAMVVGAATVAVLGAVTTIGSEGARALSRPFAAQQFYLLASINLGLFALLVGMRTFTDEFQHGTAVTTFLLEPRRERVLLAKVVVGAAQGAGLVAAGLAVTLGVAIPLMDAKGVAVGWSGDDVVPAIGLVASGALWGTIGAATGALVRHHAAAMVGGVVWVLAVENLGAAFVGDVAKLLPGQAARGLADASAAGADLLSPPMAAAVLAGWVLALGWTALVTLRRRDVVTA